MSCGCTPEVSVVPGCLNGIDAVSIHYDYVRDSANNIIGVNTKVTRPDGTLVVIGPSDELKTGACPMPVTVVPIPNDYEKVYYDDSSVVSGAHCRQILLVADAQMPPTFSGFELNGTPVAGFDMSYVTESCPCTPRTPSVVW